MMQIIPVIDLLNGVVVHAKQGDRQRYQPIKSLLTDSSQPLDIVAALLAVYPFQQLYIADLNAIQKIAGLNAINYPIIEAIAQGFPQLELWIDTGICSDIALNTWQKRNSKLVLGTENFTDLTQFTALKNQHKSPFVLSLDFMPNGFKGPTELLKDNSHWPKEVIVMCTKNVGSNHGFDSDLTKKIIQKMTDHHVYVAGGVRGLDDLIQLKKMQVHGALIATALHQKQLTYQQLEGLDQ